MLNDIMLGDFVIIDQYEDSKTKIGGEISNILYKDQIRHLKNRCLW